MRLALKNAKYRACVDKPGSVLWINSGPGTGKTALAIHLTQNLQQDARFMVLYCFVEPSTHSAGPKILRSLLYQLLDKVGLATREIIASKILSEFQKQGGSIFADKGDTNLWKSFCMMAAHKALKKPVVCVIDGLDECEESTLASFLRNLRICAGHEGLYSTVVASGRC